MIRTWTRTNHELNGREYADNDTIERDALSACDALDIVILTPRERCYTLEAQRTANGGRREEGWLDWQLSIAGIKVECASMYMGLMERRFNVSGLTNWANTFCANALHARFPGMPYDVETTRSNFLRARPLDRNERGGQWRVVDEFVIDAYRQAGIIREHRVGRCL